MSEENHLKKEKNGVFLILFKDNVRKEVFLVFRSDYPIWVLTGGGIEKGETAEKAALREAEEETGFKVKLIKKIGTYRVLNKKAELLRITFFFEGRRTDGDFKPEFPGCKGKWFNIESLPVDLTFRTKQKIFDALNFSGQSFIKTIKQEPVLDNFQILLRHPIAAVRYIRDKYLK